MANPKAAILTAGISLVLAVVAMVLFVQREASVLSMKSALEASDSARDAAIAERDLQRQGRQDDLQTHEDEKWKIRSQSTAEIEALKASHEAQLVSLAESHFDALAELAKSHSDAVAELEASLAAQTEASRLLEADTRLLRNETQSLEEKLEQAEAGALAAREVVESIRATLASAESRLASMTSERDEYRSRWASSNSELKRVQDQLASAARGLSESELGELRTEFQGGKLERVREILGLVQNSLDDRQVEFQSALRRMDVPAIKSSLRKFPDLAVTARVDGVPALHFVLDLAVVASRDLRDYGARNATGNALDVAMLLVEAGGSTTSIDDKGRIPAMKFCQIGNLEKTAWLSEKATPLAIKLFRKKSDLGLMDVHDNDVWDYIARSENRDFIRQFIP